MLKRALLIFSIVFAVGAAAFFVFPDGMEGNGERASRFPGQTDSGRTTIALKQVGEIAAQCGPGPDDYFWDIFSLCFDSEGALYVADRGWGKVFKLDAQGRFLKSFGKQGQGPAEFLGDNEYIAVGNDGFLYVSSGFIGGRISRFDREGKFLVSMPTDRSPGPPIVNSKGEIFIVSAGAELISVHRFGDAQPRKIFFPEAFHFDDPFLKPSDGARRFADSHFLPLAIAKDDGLVVVSNVSLKAFVFGLDFREIRRFDVGDEIYRAALRKRFEQTVKRNPRAGILPFTPFLAPDRKLYLFTYNTERKAFDALVYSLDGRLKAVLQIPAEISSPFAVNARGEIYGVKDQTVLVRFAPPFS